MIEPRRFPPPWTYEDHNDACFIVKDKSGFATANIAKLSRSIPHTICEIGSSNCQLRDTTNVRFFFERNISSWQEFYDFVFELNSFEPHGWIYRGQSKDWELRTAIERALRAWAIDLTNATTIEFQTIREFRRRLRDPQYSRVHNDTLFCLALMQHHGAPTRLLDCSYSPFAAAAFAMEKGAKEGPVVWCFRQFWLESGAREKTPNKNLLDRRNDDRQRTDDTFLRLYQLYQLDGEAQSEPVVQFVKSENPLHLNERLTAQQGVFLCPADLELSFADNLKAMSDWNSKGNVVKLRLTLDEQKTIEFARNLKSMNLSFAALFPGLEGFARSIGQQMFHYQELAAKRAGRPPRADQSD